MKPNYNPQQAWSTCDDLHSQSTWYAMNHIQHRWGKWSTPSAGVIFGSSLYRCNIIGTIKSLVLQQAKGNSNINSIITTTFYVSMLQFDFKINFCFGIMTRNGQSFSIIRLVFTGFDFVFINHLTSHSGELWQCIIKNMQLGPRLYITHSCLINIYWKSITRIKLHPYKGLCINFSVMIFLQRVGDQRQTSLQPVVVILATQMFSGHSTPNTLSDKVCSCSPY